MVAVGRIALCLVALSQERTQVREVLEELPNVRGCAVDPMRVKVVQVRIVAVAVESGARFPFHNDHDLAWNYLTYDILTKLSERDDAPAV